MGQLGLGYSGGVGTTPEDHQAVIYSQYFNADQSPMLSGGIVSGRSDLRYAYTAGVGLVRTAAGAAFVTWPAGTTALVAAPSAARTDTIYVTASGIPQVTTGAPPANVAILGKRRLAAGAPSTQAGTSDWNRVWALSRDGSLGWLGTHGEVHPHGSNVPTGKQHLVANVGFWVPTDRNILIQVHSGFYGQTDPGWPATDARSLGLGVMRYWLTLDGTLRETWEFDYTRAYAVREHHIPIMGIDDGEHTVKVERQHTWGSWPLFFGGGTDKYPGGFIGIRDVGVAE